MAENSEIFIRSDEKKIDLIVKACESLLKAINCDLLSLKALKPDSKYGGYRIRFSDDSIASYFLKQKFLSLPEKKASIHSSTTKLIIHDIIPDNEDEFKEMVQEQFEAIQLGPVLRICSIPISPQYPEIQTGDWKVEVDIPEIEDLVVFTRNRLPNDMSLPLFLGHNATVQEKRISFFCTICDSKEHSRQQCSRLIDCSNSDTSNRSVPQNSSESNMNFGKFEIRDRTQMNVPSPSTSKSAKQLRIETIAGNLERKKTQCFTQHSAEAESREIKHEPKDDELAPPPNVLSRPSLKHSLEESNSGRSSKKLRFATVVEQDPHFSANAPASNSSDRDSPIVVYESLASLSSWDPPTESISQYNTENSHQEDSNFSNLPTSSQPETSFDRDRSDLTGRDLSDLSDSNDNPHFPRATRKKPTYAPVVLPGRIKKLVLNQERKEGELDVDQLEAFFNHVKKKMSPAKIAKLFTPDVQGLRQQLDSIVKQYYQTPKAGSAEEVRFVKWLVGMLERFDSVPSKRKKLKSEPID